MNPAAAPSMTSRQPPRNGEPAGTQPTKPLGATEIFYRRLFEEAEPPDQGLAAPPRGNQTILVVEDTGWLREVIQRGLRAFGHTVLEAAHGEEAIQLAETYQETIHLLLSDLVLPGISGRRLAARLGALKPGIKLLYMSGYPAETVVQHGVLDPGTAFIQKPFPPGALARKVREVLDG
jgi:CheY-like chemotaxis protein